MAQARLLGNRYRLDSVVGQGGMGTVWRAFDVMLDREVAVKEVVLPPGLTPSERAVLYERTFREARASARLNHSGVVTVHDVVEESDRPWIVMELVLAPSLQDIIERGPMEHRRVADIGLQVLGALQHAHQKGILHRDVKPSNVLITDIGRAVLTDFGIAQVEGDSTLTQTGLVMGSPAYIPPERVQGERAVPASDLWSLGATLYAAVEGRSPYERSDAMSSLQAALTEPVPPARNAGPLTMVLDGLLRREPVNRMTAAQAHPLLTQVATMPMPLPSQADETVADEPSARYLPPAGRTDDASETVLDPEDLDPVTRRDHGDLDPVTRRDRGDADPDDLDPGTRRDPGRFQEQNGSHRPPPSRAGQNLEARTMLETEWAPPPGQHQPPQPQPQRHRPHPGLPPQTPPPWEQPQQFTNWQQPPPPSVHGDGGERRKTVLVVTVAVVLVVAAVLLGAFILRGKLRTDSLGVPAGQAFVTASPAICAPPAVTEGCSDTTSVITM
ncbi:serine/threonine protein kinase [Actinomadura darangshiensis]|uniref:non-specific serine/threonine protein kinase n=1 Tax=Actinomadura darangshiensis TaxID=705336 RepID=A0A4R5A1K8_9ACTN|nr:serine/threonine-protein kinase [Actinomadura darangshiensis]TDD65748.1 serine/threonine protein kinase [Actinomadura darangshiensis]